jgi:hypothetical protein
MAPWHTDLQPPTLHHRKHRNRSLRDRLAVAGHHLLRSHSTRRIHSLGPLEMAWRHLWVEGTNLSMDPHQRSRS